VAADQQQAMSRFDVHANPDVGERKHTPYLVDVQNDFIDGLATRVVIPLRRESAFALGRATLIRCCASPTPRSSWTPPPSALSRPVN
jgi:hypothetical protein